MIPEGVYGRTQRNRAQEVLVRRKRLFQVNSGRSHTDLKKVRACKKDLEKSLKLFKQTTFSEEELSQHLSARLRMFLPFASSKI